jgi:aryl-alcohol dehydrogenase-like predicted oxidoreductase
MQYTRLGKTGLQVSRLCLGCMTFGEPLRGPHEWTLDEEKTRPILVKAIESGINFFDTANMYSDGSSEEIVGKLLQELAPRDELVIATKVYGRMRPGPNGAGLSRKAILHEIDQSLKRLGTDYVDLYQIHRLDRETPMEEILEALHDVVKAGKARYIGASSMYAWQFAKLQHAAVLNGWTRFAAMQDQYNVLKREEERDMIPLCLDQAVGLTPYSPLAKGRATRPWGEQTARSSSDNVAKAFDRDGDKPVVDAIHQVADDRGVTMAQVALAWVLSKPVVSCPIVGATMPNHLADAVAALDLSLTEADIATVEAPYTPQDNYWW